jgi:hypothetical protein
MEAQDVAITKALAYPFVPERALRVRQTSGLSACSKRVEVRLHTFRGIGLVKPNSMDEVSQSNLTRDPVRWIDKIN